MMWLEALGRPDTSLTECLQDTFEKSDDVPIQQPVHTGKISLLHPPPAPANGRLVGVSGGGCSTLILQVLMLDRHVGVPSNVSCKCWYSFRSMTGVSSLEAIPLHADTCKKTSRCTN